MNTPIIGYMTFYGLNVYFFVFGFLGWVAEVAYSALKKGKFINRGFLNGTICPIYGVGMSILVLFLNPLQDKWWLLFIVGALFTTALEFLTGFVLDKLFKTKWWDYSDEPFNFKGYVCLRFSILWGIVVVTLFNTLVPLVNKIIEIIAFEWLGFIILTILWLTFIADFVVTILQLKNLMKDLKEARKIATALHDNSNKVGERIFDATIKVGERVNNISNKLKKSRLVKAFPRLDVFNKEEKIKEKKHIKK